MLQHWCDNLVVRQLQQCICMAVRWELTVYVYSLHGVSTWKIDQYVSSSRKTSTDCKQHFCLWQLYAL